MNRVFSSEPNNNLFLSCIIKASVLAKLWEFLQTSSTSCVMLSHFIRVQLFATLWTVTSQAPLSLGFSRLDYRRGLPCPPPGDLPHPGIDPRSLNPNPNPNPNRRWVLYQLRNQGSPRILEGVVMPASGGSSPPRDRTRVSDISSTGRQGLHHGAPQAPAFQGGRLRRGAPRGALGKAIRPADSHRGVEASAG